MKGIEGRADVPDHVPGHDDTQGDPFAIDALVGGVESGRGVEEYSPGDPQAE